MPIKILMPALSPTMTEGNLVKWLKKEGDSVKSGQVLAEIETDKATMEVESVDEGILGKIIIPEGTENVAVNSLIGLILEEGEDASALDSADIQSTPLPIAAPCIAPSVATAQPTNIGIAKPLNDERLKASPLARRLAEQNQLALNQIDGSGPKGRIVKRDIENALSSSSLQENHVSSNLATFIDIPMTNIRKVIAKRLTESKQNIPHFYLTVDCCMDALLKMRAEINAIQTDVKISVNDLVIKACALALKDNPQANATFHDTYVRQYSDVDIAVAVAIEGGLVTPLVRQAQNKSISQISKEMKDLASRARAGKLKPEEFQGGGFSLSNLGMYGIKNFNAIINPPQASILAVGASVKQPVVSEDGLISIATMMNCTLSVDHRVIDGALGAELLQSIKKYIENPMAMLI